MSFKLENICLIKKPRSLGPTPTIMGKKNEIIKFNTISELIEHIQNLPFDSQRKFVSYLDNMTEETEYSFRDLVHSSAQNGEITLEQLAFIHTL